MASDHLAEGPLQRTHLQLSTQPHCYRDVISSAARLQLVQKPQSLLRERQRHSLASLNSSERHCLTPTTCSQPRFHLPCQTHYLRMLEHLPQRQLDAEHAIDLRHHLRRQQRVTAQLEEVVMHTQRTPAKNLTPDARHLRFYLCPRRLILLLRRPQTLFRCWQRPPV